jgi:hypothetical protein
MRKHLPLAVIAAGAAVMLLPMASAFAATPHVLTIGKAGGTAVKTNAVLKAALAKGKDVTFAVPGETLTCTAATFASKVTSNPSKPGTADESQTSQTFSKCKVSITGATVKSIKAGDLPYKVTVSDKGDVVKVSESSKTKPLEFTAVVSVSGIGTVTCVDQAASITGKASNSGNTITFTKQKFSPKAGGNPLCGTKSGAFSATFGPVTDSSVHGNPKVFVN